MEINSKIIITSSKLEISFKTPNAALSPTRVSQCNRITNAPSFLKQILSAPKVMVFSSLPKELLNPSRVEVNIAIILASSALPESSHYSWVKLQFLENTMVDLLKIRIFLNDFSISLRENFLNSFR